MDIKAVWVNYAIFLETIRKHSGCRPLSRGHKCTRLNIVSNSLDTFFLFLLLIIVTN